MKLLHISVLLLLTISARAQQLKGKVMDTKEQPIAGALVRWIESNKATKTASDGVFILERTANDQTLVISMPGFYTDTLNITLEKYITFKLLEKTMKEVTIKGSKEEGVDSKIRMTELIGCNELNKLACCNLSESFENSNTIDVVYADGATGSKEIHMLGLDGAYTQIYFENMPFIRGMTQSVGLEAVPGTWIDEIAVNKGAGSVVNGYESMAGQINLEFKKPRNTDRLFLNLFVSEIGKTDINMQGSHRFSDDWAGELFLHTNFQPTEIDYNKDNFLDMALTRNFSVYNKWHYTGSDKFAAQFGFQSTYDKRIAGQVHDHSLAALPSVYEINMETIMNHIFAKTGFKLKGDDQSIGITYRYSYHQQKGNIGFKPLDHFEHFAHINAIYQGQLFNSSKHMIKAGVSFLYDYQKETLGTTFFNKDEQVPGVFAEHAFANDWLNIVSGLRYDYHSQWGHFVTPRIMLKFKAGDQASIRISAGKGFRTVSLISENLGYMISSREVKITEVLRPEESWNYGLMGRHVHNFGKIAMETDASFFYTFFDNQVVIDVETNRFLSFYNLKGRSTAYSFQIDQKWVFGKQFDVKWSYKNDYVQSNYTAEVIAKPLIIRDKILLNPEWRFGKEKFKTSTTLLLNGNSRIPVKTGGESGTSPWFAIWHALFTYMPNKQTDIYVGCENILNYRQRVLILGAQDPFGPDFDAGMIWGPTDGRRFYMGIKWKLNYK